MKLKMKDTVIRTTYRIRYTNGDSCLDTKVLNRSYTRSSAVKKFEEMKISEGRKIKCLEELTAYFDSKTHEWKVPSMDVYKYGKWETIKFASGREYVKFRDRKNK